MKTLAAVLLLLLFSCQNRPKMIQGPRPVCSFVNLQKDQASYEKIFEHTVNESKTASVFFQAMAKTNLAKQMDADTKISFNLIGIQYLIYAPSDAALKSHLAAKKISVESWLQTPASVGFVKELIFKSDLYSHQPVPEKYRLKSLSGTWADWTYKPISGAAINQIKFTIQEGFTCFKGVANIVDAVLSPAQLK